jgi:hypothetical protein
MRYRLLEAVGQGFDSLGRPQLRGPFRLMPDMDKQEIV